MSKQHKTAHRSHSAISDLTFTATAQPLGHRTKYIYDSSGQTLIATNAVGEQTVTTRDALGRVVSVQVFAPGAGTALRTTATVYSPDHNSYTVWEGTGSTAIPTVYASDTYGDNVLTIRYPLYPTVSRLDYTWQAFDAAGNRIARQDRSWTNSIVTVYGTNGWTYDGLNRVKTETSRDGAVTAFAYDSLSDLTNRSMPGNLTWSATYSSSGQILTEKDTGGGQTTRSNSYNYYSSGNIWAGLLNSITDGRSVTRTSTYDDFLRLSTVTTSGSLPEQQMTLSWQYDARSFPTNITQAFASTNTGPSTGVQRLYNAYGQVINDSVTLAGMSFTGVTQGWDAAGRRSQMVGGNGSALFEYRADGLLSAVNDAVFGYGDNGLLAGRTNSFRSYTVNQRDGAGRLLQATTKVGSLTALSEVWAWTGDGLPSSYTATRSDFVSSWGFGYGAATRRLTNEILNVSSTASVTNGYTFDNGAAAGLGVLTKAGVTSSGWSGGLDTFARVSAETNTLIHRPAYGRINGPATVTASLDSRPESVILAGTNAAQWRTTLDLTPGAHQLAVSATHPSGYFVTNATSWFTNNGADHASDTYDGNGQVTQRQWINSSNQVVRTQTLTWDAFERLVKVTDRDSSNSGYNWQADFDPLSRRARTTIVPVTNNVVLSSQPSTILHTYDPQVEFLEVGVVVNGTATFKTYGPDLDGRYGGQQGLGGLEELTTMVGSVGVLQDSFGDILGSVTNGTLLWNAARVNVYGPVDGYPAFALESTPLSAEHLSWRGKWRDVTGLYYWGARPYDAERRSFLSFDVRGHPSTPDGYAAFGGNPAFYWDPDGRCLETAWKGIVEVLDRSGDAQALSLELQARGGWQVGFNTATVGQRASADGAGPFEAAYEAGGYMVGSFTGYTPFYEGTVGYDIANAQGINDPIDRGTRIALGAAGVVGTGLTLQSGISYAQSRLNLTINALDSFFPGELMPNGQPAGTGPGAAYVGEFQMPKDWPGQTMDGMANDHAIPQALDPNNPLITAPENQRPMPAAMNSVDKAPFDAELAQRYSQLVNDLQRYENLSLDAAKSKAWQAMAEEIQAHANSVPARPMNPSQLDELPPK